MIERNFEFRNELKREIGITDLMNEEKWIAILKISDVFVIGNLMLLLYLFM